MSKFICLMLALVLLLNCFSFVACSGGGGGTASTASPTATGQAKPTPKPATSQKGLTINDFSVWATDYLTASYGNPGVWCSVSVVDSKGNPVTGLTGNSFKLNEALISSSGEVLQEQLVNFDDPYVGYEGNGFWERSVTGEKLDIIFAVDCSGSMGSRAINPDLNPGPLAGIRSELREFIDRLKSQKVDYRVGFIGFHGAVAEVANGWWIQDGVTLYGFGADEEKISEEIVSLFSWQGSDGNSPVSLDAIMCASQSDFREDARKVIVVITDMTPLTVYGDEWYDDNSTAATYSAVAQIIKDSGIELFYSLGVTDEMIEIHQDLLSYVGYAKASENCFEVLRGLGLAREISWPFREEDLEIKGGNIVESEYYLVWWSGFNSFTPQGTKVRVTVKVADPERPGEFLENTFSFTAGIELGYLTLNFTDEAGNPIDNIRLMGFEEAHLQVEMSDLKVYYYYNQQSQSQGGRIVLEGIPVGNYYLYVTSVEWPQVETYERLSYTKRERIHVASGEATLSIQVETMDKEIDMAKARGLLTDLKNWGYLDKPFSDFADEATAWLDELEKGGVTLQESEAIKRFYVALSGYVNTTGYADAEIERAVADFVAASKEARELLQKLTDTSDNLDKSLQDDVTQAALTAYAASAWISTYSATAVTTYATEEIATKAVLDYVKGPLMKEVIDQMVSTMVSKIVSNIPVSGDLQKVLKILFEAIVFKHWDNKDEVMQTVAELGLGAAQNEVNSKLTNVYENGKINDDAVIEVLARIFCEWLVLRPFYSDPLQDDMEDLLHRAQNFNSDGSLQDRMHGMEVDFEDFRRDTMYPLNWDAFKALEQQRSIDDWETTLSTISSALTALQVTTVLACPFYTPVCDRVKDIDDMMSFVEALKLLTNILQFGMKIDNLSTLESQVKVANTTIFGP